MIKEWIADGLLIASSGFHWISTKCRLAAIWVLNTRRRRIGGNGR